MGRKRVIGMTKKGKRSRARGGKLIRMTLPKTVLIRQAPPQAEGRAGKKGKNRPITQERGGAEARPHTTSTRKRAVSRTLTPTQTLHGRLGLQIQRPKYHHSRKKKNRRGQKLLSLIGKKYKLHVPIGPQQTH